MHHLEKSHLDRLDALARRKLKKWANLPKSATTPLLTSRSVFDLRLFSQLTERAKVGSHARMREKSDQKVQAVLDARIIRESKYKKRAKPTVHAEQIYSQIRAEAADELKSDSIIDKARQKVDALHEQACLQKLSTLTVQGKFAEVIKLQSGHPFFKSTMFDLPQKQLSFLMRDVPTCCLPLRTSDAGKSAQ